MSILLSTLTASAIKNVQRGTASITSTNTSVTITAVNTAKAFLRFSWKTTNATSAPTKDIITGSIASSTSLSFFAGSTVSGSTVSIDWEVIEFN